MKTREFNLCNWSGDTAVVSYNVARREFEFQGEIWTISKIEHVSGGTCITELFGIGWTGKLTSVIFDTGPGHHNMMEEAIVAACRWIANHV